MKMLTRLISLAGTALTVSAQTYSIHMERSVPIGQLFNFSATGSTRLVVNSGARNLKSDELTVKFVGQAKVRRIDKRGQPYGFAFTVEKFTRAKGSAEFNILPPGTVIFADCSTEQKLSFQGGMLDKPAEKAFSVIYTCHIPDSPEDDDIFDMKQPHSIGDTWPINSKLEVESVLKETGFVIPADKLTGNMHLDSISEISGAPCSSLTAEMNADDVSASESVLGFSLSRASLRATFSGCYPLKESDQSYRSSQKASFKFEGSAPNGQLLNGTYENISSGEWTAIADTP